MVRFLNVVLFVMVVAFGLVPAAALAQQPRVVREDGRDVLLVPVRGRMDLGAVVRLGNQHAAPGTIITADVVVGANPGKINYACYRGPGDHHGSRNPANWQTCSASQQRRWVVTGLEYRVPLQPTAAEQNVVSSAPTTGAPTQPVPAAGSVSTPVPAVMTDAERDALNELRFSHGEATLQQMPGIYRHSMNAMRGFAEYAYDSKREQRVLWLILFLVSSAGVVALVKSFWPSRQETVRSFVPAFVGASVPGSTAISGDTKRKFEAPVLRTSPSIVPSPREFAAGVRSLPPPIPNASPAETMPVPQDNVAQAHGLALNLAAEQRSAQAFAAGKERLPRLLCLTDKLYWKLHDTVHSIRTLEELPPEAPGRKKYPERFAAQLAKLKLRERIVAPRFTKMQQAFDTLHHAHTGLRLPRLWEAPDEQLLQHRADAKLLHHELDQVQAKLDGLEQALLSANRATAVAKEEAESQRKLHAAEVARLDRELAIQRAEDARKQNVFAEESAAQRRQINALEQEIVDRTAAYAVLEANSKQLSTKFLELSDVIREQGVQLTTVTRENKRLKAQNARFKVRLETAPGNGNDSSQDAAKAPTRKITQPFVAVQRTSPPATGSRLPPKRSGKTDPPTSG